MRVSEERGEGGERDTCKQGKIREMVKEDKKGK